MARNSGGPNQAELAAEERVLMYYDNSNMFIESKKLAAKRQKFRPGIDQDPRARLDVGKLFDLASAGREVFEANLYGSVPPPSDSFWKAIEERKIKVKRFPKSKITKKEKRTDTDMTADAVEDILTNKDYKGEQSIILFSGDLDFMSTVEKALKHKYKVEIWSLKKALKSDLANLGKRNDRVKIRLIDDVFDDVAYYARHWRFQLPKERTIMLE
jgi:uncharacterized LabA/DUF88 family protein